MSRTNSYNRSASAIVSIAICTWNRADLLDQTLAEMRKLRIPDGLEWELLVVNNNCTDHTDEVIARHSDALPIQRLLETKQGHSNARNCAIDHARGDLLIWTDDDVLVDCEWLAEYLHTAQEFPEATFFGGPIEPWYESEPPKWISHNIHWIQGPFAIAQKGEELRRMTDRETPTGANMAFRTQQLRQIRQFAFRPELGRNGDTLISSDEKEVVDRLREAGYYGVWVGSARVRHFVPCDRMSHRYLREWYRGAGRTDVRMGQYDNSDEPRRVPRWIRRKYYTALAKRTMLGFSSGKRWFHAFRSTAYFRGVIDELSTRS